MRPPKPIVLLAFAVLVTSALSVARAESAEGVISGTVRLVGPVPSIPSVLPQTDFDTCGSEARPTQSLSLGAGQTVRDAIIYLAGYAQAGANHGTNAAV